jgi:hypothetical protein
LTLRANSKNAAGGKVESVSVVTDDHIYLRQRGTENCCLLTALATGTTMFQLLEIELTRVRRMAEQAGDAFLLYLIDLAILEANAKGRRQNAAPGEFSERLFAARHRPPLGAQSMHSGLAKQA